MNILIVSLNVDPLGKTGKEFGSGQGKYVREFGLYLSAIGCKIFCVTINNGTQPSVHEVNPSFRIYRIARESGKPYDNTFTPEESLGLFDRIYSSLPSPQKINAVLSCYWISAIVGDMLAKHTNALSVLSLCSTGLERSEGLGKSLNYRISTEKNIIFSVDAIIASSKNEKKFIINSYKSPPDKISVIPRGFSNENFFDLPYKSIENPLVFSAGGRLAAQKGYDLLLKYLSTVSNFPWKLNLFGFHKSDFCSVVDIPKEILDRISWLGPIDNTQLHKTFHKTDLLFVPSRYETFGNIALEAVASGCPAFVSDVGALPEIIKPNINGFVYKSKNSEDFKKKLFPVFNDPSILIPLKAQCAKSVEQYAWEKLSTVTKETFCKWAKR